MTVVTVVATLFAETRSCSLADAVAVFVIDPGTSAAPAIVTVARPPDAMSPNVQTTVRPCSVHDPVLARAERNLTPPGSKSFNRAAVAVLGPWLETTRI